MPTLKANAPCFICSGTHHDMRVHTHMCPNMLPSATMHTHRSLSLHLSIVRLQRGPENLESSGSIYHRGVVHGVQVMNRPGGCSDVWRESKVLLQFSVFIGKYNKYTSFSDPKSSWSQRSLIVAGWIRSEQ